MDIYILTIENVEYTALNSNYSATELNRLITEATNLGCDVYVLLEEDGMDYKMILKEFSDKQDVKNFMLHPNAWGRGFLYL